MTESNSGSCADVGFVLLQKENENKDENEKEEKNEKDENEKEDKEDTKENDKLWVSFSQDSFSEPQNSCKLDIDQIWKLVKNEACQGFVVQILSHVFFSGLKPLPKSLKDGSCAEIKPETLRFDDQGHHVIYPSFTIKTKQSYQTAETIQNMLKSNLEQTCDMHLTPLPVLTSNNSTYINSVLTEPSIPNIIAQPSLLILNHDSKSNTVPFSHPNSNTNNTQGNDKGNDNVNGNVNGNNRTILLRPSKKQFLNDLKNKQNEPSEKEKTKLEEILKRIEQSDKKFTAYKNEKQVKQIRIEDDKISIQVRNRFNVVCVSCGEFYHHEQECMNWQVNECFHINCNFECRGVPEFCPFYHPRLNAHQRKRCKTKAHSSFTLCSEC